MAPSRRFSSVLARTSAFPRTEAHLVQHTTVGAVVTLCGALLMVLLLTSELRDFLNVRSTKKVTGRAWRCRWLALTRRVAAGRGQQTRPLRAAHVSGRLLQSRALLRRDSCSSTYLSRLQLTLRAGQCSRWSLQTWRGRRRWARSPASQRQAARRRACGEQG